MSGKVIGERLALGRRQYLGHIGDEFRDSPGSLLGNAHMGGARRLECGAINAVLRKQVEDLLVPLIQLLVQWREVVRGLLTDGSDLCFLRFGRTDFRINVLQHAVDVGDDILGTARHRVAAVMPAGSIMALRHGTGADGDENAEKQSDRSGGLEQQSANDRSQTTDRC